MFDVIEVQIKAPHETRVMAVDLTENDADAFIKFAVIRRGVEHQFYKAVPAGKYRKGEAR